MQGLWLFFTFSSRQNDPNCSGGFRRVQKGNYWCLPLCNCDTVRHGAARCDTVRLLEISPQITSIRTGQHDSSINIQTVYTATTQTVYTSTTHDVYTATTDCIYSHDRLYIQPPHRLYIQPPHILYIQPPHRLYIQPPHRLYVQPPQRLHTATTQTDCMRIVAT